MNFSVNFMDRASVVLKEATQLKKYKAMPRLLAILVGIFMLPLAVAGYFFAGLVYVFGYLYAVSYQPVKNLHALLKEEGQNVKHGTQVVIYFLSWSGVFSAYVLLTSLMVSLTIMYTIFAILTYIWTLGGFKFHVFAAEEDISIEVNGNYRLIIPIVYLCIMVALLLLIPGVRVLVILIKDLIAGKTIGSYLWWTFKQMVSSTSFLRLLVSVLYSAIVFAPNPKTDTPAQPVNQIDCP